MTKRTTASRLLSYHKKITAKHGGGPWYAKYTKENNHPLPKLPDQEYLEGHYLQEIISSAPKRAREILKCIQTVRAVRTGEIEYEGRRSPERE